MNRNKKWLRRALTSALGATCIAALLLASCGDPFGPGLGTVQINDGSDIAVSTEFAASIDTSAPPDGTADDCAAASTSAFLQVAVFKTGTNTGDIAFGGSDFNAAFDPPPDTEIITDADVVLAGIDSVTQVQHAHSANALFFQNPSLIVDTTSGFALINTGSGGVSYLVVTFSSGQFSDTVDPLEEFGIIPAGTGGGIQVSITLTCST